MNIDRPLLDLLPIVKEVGGTYAQKLEQARLEKLDDIRCACGKLKKIHEFGLYNTGKISAINNVCAGCVKSFAQMVPVVCTNCKIPVIWVSPHKDDAGFEFVLGRVYHVNACPACFPDAKKAIPLEKIVFDYRRSGTKLDLKTFANQCIKNL